MTKFKKETKLFQECFENEYGFYTQPISTTNSDKILFANAYGKTKEECLSNAKLIATAPEMLEMLESILKLQKENYGNGSKTHMLLMNKATYIEQLIKKATK